jgi:ribonuclease E
MGNKMLIDAAHPEETRVVVVRGNRIDEFDFESANRKQLRGNIYLAKVTRVEPSLQAAFVDYGGNRHGFLAFSEIHPDYYQIPVADRQALLAEDQEDETVSSDDNDDAGEASAADIPEEPGEEEAPDAEETGSREDEEDIEAAEDDASDQDNGGDDSGEEAADIESLGAEDAFEEVPQRRRKRRRDYKIQEVIKRRQIILVQVVKEERGNKGAALTTYLSLAGRYCVMMPNTPRGGGISRKITDVQDRRRLKDVAKSIEVAEGTGLIVRTAGANRTKTEIKRDFDYLLRLWENVRDLTLESTAPSLVYEEGSLIKRSIRDLYDKDVDSIEVEGETAYKEAKEFMKMLMPSHARNVKLHKENKPLFSRNQIDTQLDGLFSPQVTLPSGGYLVINQTEALVAIDVNSGKSTREHSIEITALKTNLEAAQEVGRQFRLRDLAGLIVIDFIDMEERRNNRKVEAKMKDVLKNDRARIQVGRISPFGLLEMSRQRMRSGVLEGSTRTCDHCEGRGYIRSVESCALSVLRGIEDHLISRRNPENLSVRCQDEVALYILNQKRDHLSAVENAYNIVVYVENGSTELGSDFSISKVDGPVRLRNTAAEAVSIESAFTTAEPDTDDEAEEDRGAAQAQSNDGDVDGDGQPRKRKRRRGRRGGRRSRGAQDSETGGEQQQPSEAGETVAAEADSTEETSNAPPQEEKRGRRRRSRGGGRSDPAPVEGAEDPSSAPQPVMDFSDTDEAPAVDPWDTTPEPVKPKRRSRGRKAATSEASENDVAAAPDAKLEQTAEAQVVETEEAPAKAKPKSRSRKKAASARKPTEAASEAAAEVVAEAEKTPAKPARKRRVAKKSAEADKPDAKAAAKETEVSTPVSESEETPKPKRRSRAKAKPPSEHTAGANGETATADAKSEQAAPPPPPAAPAAPTKRGWWNRG